MNFYKYYGVIEVVKEITEVEAKKAEERKRYRKVIERMLSVKSFRIDE